MTMKKRRGNLYIVTIILLSYFISYSEAYINVTAARCCLDYDYNADGTALGCGTPTNDKVTGLKIASI